MKGKIIIPLFFTLLIFSLGATASSLKGQWIAKKIDIEKSIDGKLQTSKLRNIANVRSYIPCPEKLDIQDSSTIILHYPEGVEETANYSINSNELLIGAAGLIQVYEYKLDNNELILSITHKYDFNQPSGKSEHIQEKWTITFGR